METCPFCGRDPFHYVDNGVGMEAVAVTCCELGDEFFRGARPVPETVTLGWDEFCAIAGKLRQRTAAREALERIERWFGEFPETSEKWPDGSPVSYGAQWGSNGERDFMRAIAREALAQQ